MLVLDRTTGEIQDKHFFDIVDFVRPGDLLVVNETRVLPARLIGAKRGSEGAAELLLLKDLGNNQWEALVKPGRRLKPESKPIIDFYGEKKQVILSAEIVD